MKSWFAIFLFFFITKAFAQGQNNNCNDFKSYAQLDSLFKGNQLDLYGHHPKDDMSWECNVKSIAILADKVFDKGFDIHLKRLFVYRGQDMILIEGYVPQVDSINIKNGHHNDLIRSFCDLNHIMVNYYGHHHKSERYKLMVENIMMYGMFKHPDKVRDFLQYKYRKYKGCQW
jgi:hypothetical protein